MKLTFLGAARTVTGSCYLLRAGPHRLLVDCGMYQGPAKLVARNSQPFPFQPAKIDALILTHAHIDHIGLVPRLIHDGFHGPIWATPATTQIAAIQWLDLHDIRGEEGGPPLFSSQDVTQAYKMMSPLPYGEPTEIADGLTLTLRDAGHILGSAIVELALKDGRRVVFSGDLGPPGKPILRDPQTVEPADLVVMESTYGNRDHRKLKATTEELGEALITADRDGGVVLIPSFALGRAQEVLYCLRELSEQPDFPTFRVYLDSPQAIRFTELYRRHTAEFDDAAAGLERPLEPPNLELVRRHRDSLDLDQLQNGGLIISPSGMCDFGRISRHIATYGPRPETDIVFVGFQAPGTLGRKIVNGATSVRIRRRNVALRCHVHTLGGFSGHAGRSDLTRWLAACVEPGRTTVCLTHGDYRVMREFAEHLKEQLRIHPRLPAWKSSISF